MPWYGGSGKRPGTGYPEKDPEPARVNQGHDPALMDTSAWLGEALVALDEAGGSAGFYQKWLERKVMALYDEVQDLRNEVEQEDDAIHGRAF